MKLKLGSPNERAAEFDKASEAIGTEKFIGELAKWMSAGEARNFLGSIGFVEEDIDDGEVEEDEEEEDDDTDADEE